MSQPAWLAILALAGALAPLTLPRMSDGPHEPEREQVLPVQALLALGLALGLVAVGIVPAGERAWAALIGLIAGLGLGWACAWRVSAPVINGCALAVATLTHLVGPSALVESYTHLGLVAGISGMAVLTWLARSARLDESVQAAIATSSIAMATLWLDRSLSGMGLWALAAAGLIMACRALVARTSTGLASVSLIPLVALATIPPGLWLLTLPPAAWLTPTLGVALAGLLGVIDRFPGKTGMPRWAPLVVIGGAGFLVTRLLGMPGLTLVAMAMTLASPARGRAADWLAVASGALVLRGALQILVDRTYLQASGIDLTHPYAFASLVAGLALAWTMTRPESRRVRWIPGLVLLAPTVGLLFHTEALAACLAGILAGTLVLGLGGLATRHTRVLGPFSALAGAIALWSAPWLLVMRDVPRAPRLVVWIGLILVLSAGHFWPDRTSR